MCKYSFRSFALAVCAFSLATLSPSAKADVITSTIAEYNGPQDFDFNSADYPLSSVLIGDFTFAIPTGQTVLGATISGTFGNNDVSPNTALSDYFVDNGAINVASCDDPAANCFTGGTGEPTPWSHTFSAAELGSLSAAFASGTLDFTAVQNFAVSVATGTTTLSISITPEPATIFILCGGLAGIACLRRLRKA